MGRNTSSLALKSRLVFFSRVHVPLLAGEMRAEKVTFIPMEKARPDLNASDAVFLPLVRSQLKPTCQSGLTHDEAL